MTRTQITIHIRLPGEPAPAPEHNGHTAYRSMAVVAIAAVSTRVARGTIPPNGWNVTNALAIAAEFAGYLPSPVALPGLAEDVKLKGGKP